MATELDELLLETQRRQRRKTDLAEFDSSLKKMMDLDISLPVILEWLEKKGEKTSLPALRRYVIRIFGDEFYSDFMRRNGWLKKKRIAKPVAAIAQPDPQKTIGTKPPTSAAQQPGETTNAPPPVRRTGFHQVVEEIEKENGNADPRRDN